MRPARARFALAFATLALAAGALSACGDDEEPTTTTTAPTAPTTTTGATDDNGREESSGGKEETTGSEQPNGGVAAPESSGGAGRGQPEDSPENDIPPAPGSPAEQFEQFCDENPDACS